MRYSLERSKSVGANSGYGDPFGSLANLGSFRFPLWLRLVHLKEKEEKDKKKDKDQTWKASSAFC